MSTTRSIRSASSATRRQRGTGLIGSFVGVVMFLGFLLFAVQVAYSLYATSAVTSAAYDAVRTVAGSDATGNPTARDDAEAAARHVLGRYSSRVTFTWSGNGDVVVLRVTADEPSFLPSAWRRPLALDHIDRTVQARVEHVR